MQKGGPWNLSTWARVKLFGKNSDSLRIVLGMFLLIAMQGDIEIRGGGLEADSET
jgi:hypothetical protein